MPDVQLNPYKDEHGAPKLRLSVAAFVDFLGYSEYIEDAFKEPGRGEKELMRLRGALDVAYSYLKQRSTQETFGGPLDLQVRTFTDNLIIGCPIPEGEDSFWPRIQIESVITYVGEVQAQLARDGYFIRGAISVGELYIDEDIVFGPALMEAHRAEQQLAVFPRVILCGSAEEPFTEREVDRKVSDVLVDSDQRIFIDFLESTVMIAYPDDRPFTEFLEGHKAAVMANLKKFADKPYIRAKYEWAATYHNTFCDNHPDLFGDDDKIPHTLLASRPRFWIPNPSETKE
jgi:hypothetical protein